MIFFNNSHIFHNPEPPRERRRIYPLFLPFSGCKTRCIFCAQEIQTGRQAGNVRATLKHAEADFHKRLEAGSPPVDLAFFGGTFTALPAEELRACLDFAARWAGQGLVSRLRCSTRPDAAAPAVLASLKAAGFSMVELGIQSFDDTTLRHSRRGYNGREARQGCETVLASGMELGIQLMPGMPGSTQDTARADVDEAVMAAPHCARLYPCVVVDHTPLAALWRHGGYRAWTVDEAVDFLGPACRAFWRAGIPVIRMGLAQEPGLAANILAGPHHPELGGMAKGLALLLHIREQLVLAREAGFPSCGFQLYVPATWQGAFWGSKRALEAEYAAIGLAPGNIRWWDKEFFSLIALYEKAK